MFGSNVGEMLNAASQDRREAQANVWDEVYRLMHSGASKREVMVIAQTRARELREENAAK